jgi:hypothetical protein
MQIAPSRKEGLIEQLEVAGSRIEADHFGTGRESANDFAPMWLPHDHEQIHFALNIAKQDLSPVRKYIQPSRIATSRYGIISPANFLLSIFLSTQAAPVTNNRISISAFWSRRIDAKRR